MRSIKYLLFISGLSLLGFLSSCSNQASAAITPTALPSLIPITATLPGPGCSLIGSPPTPGSNVSSFPGLTAADHALGPADAPATLIEYCDFQTPICLSMAAVVSNLIHNHRNDLQFVFRPVPIQPINSADKLHDKSELAVQAVIAADQQAHFWEMYDILFQNNSEWSNLQVNEFNLWLVQQAGAIGLDKVKFESALNAGATASKAVSMFDSATQSGLQAFPLVILNGKPQPLFTLDYGTLDSTISLIALGARQFKSCPAFIINASKQYIARLHTERGDIVLELYPDKAPLAVNSFVFLARNGWYDGVTFTSVIPGFIAQAGDPSGTGNGGPGYLFKNETNSSLHFDVPGVVGMANSGPNTNGSQFFITYAPQPSLEGRYTIFGQVIMGMSVVESLTPRDPSKSPLLPPGDRIISVTIEEK